MPEAPVLTNGEITTVGDAINFVYFMTSDRDFLAIAKDPSRLGPALEAAARLAGVVEIGISNREVSKAISRGAEATGRIGKSITTTTDIADSAMGLALTYVALKNIDPAKVRANPQQAAVQYGQLFDGLGKLAVFLPPPLNAYSSVLGEVGAIVRKVKDAWDPESPNTPRAG